MPNAFSPNGDGLNDRLRPIWRGIAQVRYFRVFNRYGQVIFETSDPQVGWDGTFKGKQQMPGNYVWEAAGYGFRGNSVRQLGNVVLIR
jgi:gliding motility-associated-like protein